MATIEKGENAGLFSPSSGPPLLAGRDADSGVTAACPRERRWPWSKQRPTANPKTPEFPTLPGVPVPRLRASSICSLSAPAHLLPLPPPPPVARARSPLPMSESCHPLLCRASDNPDNPPAVRTVFVLDREPKIPFKGSSRHPPVHSGVDPRRRLTRWIKPVLGNPTFRPARTRGFPGRLERPL